MLRPGEDESSFFPGRFCFAGSGAVLHFLNPELTGAICAAEDVAAAFDPVPEDGTAAMRAPRCHRVGCALETIESANFLPACKGERLVVLVAAGVAYRHGNGSNL